jgi:V8-like Glu-specific endopeptidase
MKSIFIISIIFIQSALLFARTSHIKVVYGEDNRLDVASVLNPLYLKLAKSTAAMISNTGLTEYNSEQVSLGGRTLEETGVCATERFSGQPTSATCSGFLVGPDILVTAGHCIQSQADCDASSWVFDYKVDYEIQDEVIVDKSNIYKCKEIISQNLDSETQNDYAVIKFERKVEDREVLKVRRAGKPLVGQGLVVIGHPSGLPTKIAAGGVVRSVNEVFMVTNLDTYGGNSGSAVFNSMTGEVEGILVRGDTDYVWDSRQNCRISNIVATNKGRGEDVTLISSVVGIPEVEEEVETPIPPVEETPPVETVPSWWIQFLEWLRNRN